MTEFFKKSTIYSKVVFISFKSTVLSQITFNFSKSFHHFFFKISPRFLVWWFHEKCSLHLYYWGSRATIEILNLIRRSLIFSAIVWPEGLKIYFFKSRFFCRSSYKFTIFNRRPIKGFFVRGSSIYLQRFLSFDIFFLKYTRFLARRTYNFFLKILRFFKSPRSFVIKTITIFGREFRQKKCP